MKRSKWYFIFLFFFLMFSFFLNFKIVNSTNVEISINETSSLKKLLNGQYSLEAKGVLSIYNPSNTSRVYEFVLPLELDSLIGINKISYDEQKSINSTYNYTVFLNCSNCSYMNLTNFNCSECSSCENSTYLDCTSCFNSTNSSSFTFNCGNCTSNETRFANSTSIISYSDAERFSFSYDKIKGYMIEPGERVDVGYEIFGLLPYNIYESMSTDDQSVLDYYVKSYDIVSKVIVNLQKPQREGFEYNLDRSLNSSPTNDTSRLISTQIRNPTDFSLFIKNLKLYRTNVSDVMFENSDLIKTFENIDLEKFEYIEKDFTDIQSNDYSVYWMSSEIFINYDLFSSTIKDYQVEPKKSDSKKSSGGGSGFSSFGKNHFNKEYSILVKKETDKTLITNGEEFEVILRVVNVNDVVLEDLILTDIIPEGYEIKDVSDSVKISKGVLEFDISSIDEYETLEIRYKLVAKKNFKGITYLKPAKLVYDDREFFSEGVLVVNDLLPNERVFIQKEVKYVDENYARVTIIVKNLGNYGLEDLLITDNIPFDASIKDISQMFYEKGSWMIKKLDSGDEWKVSYLVSRNENLDSLPNLFGIESEDVFSTLIFSEEIITSYQEDSRLIEKVGMGVAVTFLVLYLLF